MARFISQEDMPMKLRRPHLDRYKRQLRDALMNPGMAEHDKAKVRVKLAAVGKPKVYGKISVPGETTEKSGAVQTTEVEPKTAPIVGQTRDDLLAMSHDELMALAQSEGLVMFKSWSKDKKADTILAHRAAEGS
jgi:hypothetical protein